MDDYTLEYDVKAANRQWVKKKGPDLANAVFELAQEIEETQGEMRESWVRYTRAYSGRDEAGLTMDLQPGSDSTLTTENAIKSAVDTAASMIAKNRVKPRVLTNGGSFSEQRRAKRLERFIYGEMHYQKAYEIGPAIFRDACCTGTGVWKVLEQDGRIVYERRLISDIIVDEREALYGKPREMFERRMVHRDELIRLFPKSEKELTEVKSTDNYYCSHSIPDNYFIVIEAWRPGESHCIVTENITLLSENYTEDYFPFVFFRYDGLPISGFYGLGPIRDVYGAQIRINEINAFTRKCQDLIAVPRVLVNVSSNIKKVQLNNEIGMIIPYIGNNPPIFHTPQAVSPEIYQEKATQRENIFRYFGVSDSRVQGMKQPGIESAVAIREMSDLESGRFSIQHQRYESMYTDLGELTVKIAASAFKGKRNLKSRFPNKNLIETIEWSEVNIEKDRFTLDIQPAGIANMTPSGKMATVTELAQMQLLDKSEVRYLLNHPDMESSHDIATADYRDATRVEELLLDGKYEPPEPFQNLQLLVKRLQLKYLQIRSEFQEVPEEILEGIRDYISACKSLIEMSAQAGMEQPVEELPVNPQVGGENQNG